MVLIQFLYIVLVHVEIFRNWCIIESGQRRPTYWWSNVIRLAIGFGFWILSPLIVKMNEYRWWGMLPMMLFTGWWIFDYGLNLWRKWIPGKTEFNKPFYYLNPKGSPLDRLQAKAPLVPVFWAKMVLMIAGMYLFFTGIDSIWVVKW